MHLAGQGKGTRMSTVAGENPAAAVRSAELAIGIAGAAILPLVTGHLIR